MTLHVLNAATIIFKILSLAQDWKLEEEATELLLILCREGYRLVRDFNVGH